MSTATATTPPDYCGEMEGKIDRLDDRLKAKAVVGLTIWTGVLRRPAPALRVVRGVRKLTGGAA